MKPNLFFGSLAGFSGKTAVVLGLALTLKKHGKRVGYFKPLANQTTTEGDRPVDDDVLVAKQVLGLKHDYSTLAPITLPPHDFTRALLGLGEKRAWEKIESAFVKVRESSDMVMIEGLSDPFRGMSVGLSAPTIAERLSCRMVVVIKPSLSTPGRVLDYSLGMAEIFKRQGVETAGAIINQASSAVAGELKLAINELQKRGIKAWMIPEQPALTSPTVKDLVRELNATLLCCEDQTDKLCERFMVGAMRAQSALEFFRRVQNKAVITGGDRADIMLAALETSTNCLILTGNLYPDSAVLGEARRRGIPMILVQTDTKTTLDIIEGLPWRIRPENAEKVQLAQVSIEENVDWRALSGI